MKHNRHLPTLHLTLSGALCFGLVGCVGVADRDNVRDYRDRQDNELNTRSPLPGFDPNPAEEDVRSWIARLDESDVLVFSQAKSDLARFPGQVAQQIRKGGWPKSANGQLAVIEVLASQMAEVEDYRLLVRAACLEILESGKEGGYSSSDTRRSLRWYVDTQPWENQAGTSDAGQVLARLFPLVDRETRWEISRIVRQSPKGFPIEAIRIFEEALVADSKELRADGHQLLLGLWDVITKQYTLEDDRRADLQRVLWRINPYIDDAHRVREQWSSRLELHYPNLIRGYSTE